MIYFKDTAYGRIGIQERDGAITAVLFEGDNVPEDDVRETALIKSAFEQMEQYFAGNRREFDLPLAPAGTEFMQSCYRELLKVPFGKTRTYQQIAQAVGRPKAYRAVGLANNKNPIPIFIPCHRIIGSNGKPVGYRGGLEMKRRLLELESNG